MVDLLIPGPEGKIEAKYSHNNNLKSPIAIILHPDPSRGGTMNTKIVFKLFKIFVSNGFSTIRFNFRGVGKSEGIYDNGEGELSDAASVLDWLQQYNTNSKICWVVGFSFGAWVAMQLLMRRPEINGFVSVSPPANLRDFSFLDIIQVSKCYLKRLHMEKKWKYKLYIDGLLGAGLRGGVSLLLYLLLLHLTDGATLEKSKIKISIKTKIL